MEQVLVNGVSVVDALLACAALANVSKEEAVVSTTTLLATAAGLVSPPMLFTRSNNSAFVKLLALAVSPPTLSLSPLTTV